MAASIVTSVSNDRNSSSLVALRAAAWAILGKVAEKESVRDDIPDGLAETAEILVACRINGQVIKETYKATVNVGHKSQRASSVNPQPAAMVAFILSKLNTATREKILKDLPSDFEQNGNLIPDTGKELIESAEHLLAKLRASKQQEVRGTIAVKHSSADPQTLTIFG